jgi:hypothetical protein
MSALPPKADINGCIPHVSFVHHKRTPAVQQRKLFDHMVCKCEKIAVRPSVLVVFRFSVSS